MEMTARPLMTSVRQVGAKLVAIEDTNPARHIQMAGQGLECDDFRNRQGRAHSIEPDPAGGADRAARAGFRIRLGGKAVRKRFERRNGVIKRFCQGTLPVQIRLCLNGWIAMVYRRPWWLKPRPPGGQPPGPRRAG